MKPPREARHDEALLRQIVEGPFEMVFAYCHACSEQTVLRQLNVYDDDFGRCVWCGGYDIDL